MAGSLGDFQFYEKLTAFGGVGAIIHDKVVVIDPMDPKNCVVAFGSHNLGYKASYSNDENLTIVTGHQPLALAYTAHVLDVYDHYRFRAKQNEKAPDSGLASGAAKAAGFTGFLSVTPDWQKTTGRRLSAYFAG
jgi:phosphatidylserine/phosphatidylglycerophosphate/cardiolipin synthase-like enzyme